MGSTSIGSIWIVSAIVISTSANYALPACAQAPLPEMPDYKMSVAVDEVSLTFHASDTHGLPINDLKLDELTLLDNGKPPLKIISFKKTQDFPIRTAILLDTSESMGPYLADNRAIAIDYARNILRQQTDQAFLIDFGFISRLSQPWTSDATALASSIQRTTAGRANPLGGTALFDTIFRACFSEFGKIDHEASGNIILLFSDGEDNASHTSLKDAVDQCQHSNTAIFAFRPDPKSGYSTGPKNLVELASQTGGQVFHSDDSEAEIDTDLSTIESNLRNQYRLIYKPAELKHDDSFHHIELHAPDRVEQQTIRTGYYDRPQ